MFTAITLLSVKCNNHNNNNNNWRGLFLNKFCLYVFLHWCIVKPVTSTCFANYLDIWWLPKFSHLFVCKQSIETTKSYIHKISHRINHSGCMATLNEEQQLFAHRTLLLSSHVLLSCGHISENLPNNIMWPHL